MTRSSLPRAAAHLSDSLHHNLNAYALAASVAGVGILALATPAQAKVVYTPSNIPIPINAGLVGLDLNNDGINDFVFSDTYQLPGGTHHLIAAPRQKGNRIWSVRTSKFYRRSHHYCVATLQSNTKVGAHSPFEKKQSPLLMDWGSRGTYGCPWTYLNVGKDQGTAYIGLTFRIKGSVHFGWARVHMNGAGQTEYITGYAYETIRHKPIITGKTTGKVLTLEPASLGHLARGASGLSAWRTTNSATASH